jgi:uncharacterized protein YktA (UPF0223 family)
MEIFNENNDFYGMKRHAEKELRMSNFTDREVEELIKFLDVIELFFCNWNLGRIPCSYGIQAPRLAEMILGTPFSEIDNRFTENDIEDFTKFLNTIEDFYINWNDQRISNEIIPRDVQAKRLARLVEKKPLID